MLGIKNVFLSIKYLGDFLAFLGKGMNFEYEKFLEES